jgi:hypothetical protein
MQIDDKQTGQSQSDVEGREPIPEVAESANGSIESLLFQLPRSFMYELPGSGLSAGRAERLGICHGVTALAAIHGCLP